MGPELVSVPLRAHDILAGAGGLLWVLVLPSAHHDGGRSVGHAGFNGHHLTAPPPPPHHIHSPLPGVVAAAEETRVLPAIHGVVGLRRRVEANVDGGQMVDLPEKIFQEKVYLNP